jgi:hypothetical protein
MRVERYQEAGKNSWDDFVRRSKNGTFLFLRDYVEYHRDRFEDYSLVVLDEDDSAAALLPANIRDSSVASHGGLTYGGFVTDEQMKLPKMLEVFEATLRFLQENSIHRLVYKSVPHIYHRAPADEDLYALFLCNASLVRRGALTVVQSDHRIPVQERRKRGARKAVKNSIAVRQSVDFDAYWEILTERLRQAYDARPVHDVNEMRSLHQRFPENIKLFAAYQEQRMLAGVIIYETERVAHAQYIAGNEESRDLGALDLIFEELLTKHYGGKPFFDFGTSDEKEGRLVNRGLIDQKEGYGARLVAHDHYEVDLARWTPGQLMGALI